MPIANYAYYHVTGPVNIYVRIPNVGVGPFVPPNLATGSIAFLGQALESPEPKFDAAYVDVKSSLSGPVIPDDKIYAGGDYYFDVNLSRYAWDVLQFLTAWPMHGRGMAPGEETYFDRGRLALANGDTFQLWARNAFWGSANATAYPDMPIGYFYPACIMVNHYPNKLTRDSSLATLRIKPLSVRIGPAGGFITYTQNPTYFTDLPDVG